MKAVGIIRTKNVCRMHFTEFKIDNVKRIKQGIEIPNSLDLIKL